MVDFKVGDKVKVNLMPYAIIERISEGRDGKDYTVSFGYTTGPKHFTLRISYLHESALSPYTEEEK